MEAPCVCLMLVCAAQAGLTLGYRPGEDKNEITAQSRPGLSTPPLALTILRVSQIEASVAVTQ